MDEIIISRSETENLRRGDVKTGTMVEVNDEMEKMNNNFMCFPLYEEASSHNRLRNTFYCTALVSIFGWLGVGRSIGERYERTQGSLRFIDMAD